MRHKHAAPKWLTHEPSLVVGADGLAKVRRQQQAAFLRCNRHASQAQLRTQAEQRQTPWNIASSPPSLGRKGWF